MPARGIHKDVRGVSMNCKIHNQPLTMICARCADTMCPMCAEYIDGSWFCPKCAVRERRFAAGLDYHNIMAPSTHDFDFTEF
jgi:hypothetical protein